MNQYQTDLSDCPNPHVTEHGDHSVQLTSVMNITEFQGHVHENVQGDLKAMYIQMYRATQKRCTYKCVGAA